MSCLKALTQESKVVDEEKTDSIACSDYNGDWTIIRVAVSTVSISIPVSILMMEPSIPQHVRSFNFSRRRKRPLDIHKRQLSGELPRAPLLLGCQCHRLALAGAYIVGH